MAISNPPALFKLYVSEFIGTALLLTIGLSVVIFNWGEGSVMNHYIPEPGMRRLFTGFLFGTTGCLITLSPVGKISGASTYYWLYRLAPLTGVLLVMGFVKAIDLRRHHSIEAARVCYHHEPSPAGIKTSS